MCLWCAFRTAAEEPLYMSLLGGKEPQKMSVLLGLQTSFLCFKMLASPGQPCGWPPLSRQTKEKITNCTLGLEHQGRKGGWADGLECQGELVIKL